MYHPTTRLLTILELLQSRSHVTGPELASRLEVEVRSVRRYITLLQDLGIPVEALRGRHGGYRLRPGFKLPPLMFTEEEAVFLTLGLSVVRRTGLSQASTAIEAALAKLERTLPTGVAERVRLLQEVLYLEEAGQENITAGSLLLKLIKAATEGQSLVVSYSSQTHCLSERLVDPYGLVYWSRRWYMVGYCHLRQAVRSFRLDRILQANPHKAFFTRPANFDCLAHLLNSISNMLNTYKVEVLLKLELWEARQRIPALYGELEASESGVVYRSVADDLATTASFLAGLGCEFEVVAPPELRVALKALGLKLLEMAS